MASSTLVGVRHIVRGRVVEGAEVEYGSSDGGARFATPALDLSDLVWPRTEPLPAAEVPIEEVIDFLVETGERLDFDHNPYLKEAFAATSAVNVLGANVLEYLYRRVAGSFDRRLLELDVEQNLGSHPDGWRTELLPGASTFHVRPYPRG